MNRKQLPARTRAAIDRIVPRHATIEYIETITRDCGCVYDRFTHGVRRYPSRCAPHAVMCRSLENWEIDD